MHRIKTIGFAVPCLILLFAAPGRAAETRLVRLTDEQSASLEATQASATTDAELVARLNVANLGAAHCGIGMHTRGSHSNLAVSGAAVANYRHQAALTIGYALGVPIDELEEYAVKLMTGDVTIGDSLELQDFWADVEAEALARSTEGDLPQYLREEDLTDEERERLINLEELMEDTGLPEEAKRVVRVVQMAEPIRVLIRKAIRDELKAKTSLAMVRTAGEETSVYRDEILFMGRVADRVRAQIKKGMAPGSREAFRKQLGLSESEFRNALGRLAVFVQEGRFELDTAAVLISRVDAELDQELRAAQLRFSIGAWDSLLNTPRAGAEIYNAFRRTEALRNYWGWDELREKGDMQLGLHYVIPINDQGVVMNGADEALHLPGFGSFWSEHLYSEHERAAFAVARLAAQTQIAHLRLEWIEAKIRQRALFGLKTRSPILRNSISALRKHALARLDRLVTLKYLTASQAEAQIDGAIERLFVESTQISAPANRSRAQNWATLHATEENLNELKARHWATFRTLSAELSATIGRRESSSDIAPDAAQLPTAMRHIRNDRYRWLVRPDGQTAEGVRAASKQDPETGLYLMDPQWAGKDAPPLSEGRTYMRIVVADPSAESGYRQFGAKLNHWPKLIRATSTSPFSIEVGGLEGDALDREFKFWVVLDESNRIAKNGNAASTSDSLNIRFCVNGVRVVSVEIAEDIGD